jgi:acyl-CoA synthetase (AMP-forming)/AMP-acid ligase II
LEPGGYLNEGDPKQIRRRALSCGREAFNAEVRVVNSEGNDVQPGEIGEIIVLQSKNITMKSYWRLPEETKKILRNGWLYTGDLATVDEDGYIFITDRKDFMIISGGENVYPREVEDIIYQHPAVKEVCVVGIPDDRWGEAVKALLVHKEGVPVTEDEIIKFCKQHMAGYKSPKSVEFVSELPKDPVGKILRKEIKAWYHKN